MSDTQNNLQWTVSRKQRRNARALRPNYTDAERIIWAGLRAHRPVGASFRRQPPVGPCIADFLCHDARLIVEIDGGQHFEAHQIKRDAARDRFLHNKGYHVLRFNNQNMMTNRSGVLETILAAIQNAPSPTLPRNRGRERAGASREKMP